MLVMIAPLIAVVSAYWWANTEPTRPSGVSVDAVFLWAPYVWFPKHRNGWWIACWENAEHNWCRLNNFDGSVEYEGEFVPYRSKAAIAAVELRIDRSKTRDQKVWVGDSLVPLVYLENGDVLLPFASYMDAKSLLDRQKPKHK